MAITSLKCTGASFDVVTLPKQVFFHNSFKLGFSAKFIPSLTDWVVSFHQFSINQEDKLLSFTYNYSLKILRYQNLFLDVLILSCILVIGTILQVRLRSHIFIWTAHLR